MNSANSANSRKPFSDFRNYSGNSNNPLGLELAEFTNPEPPQPPQPAAGTDTRSDGHDAAQAILGAMAGTPAAAPPPGVPPYFRGAQPPPRRVSFSYASRIDEKRGMGHAMSHPHRITDKR